MLVTLAVIGVIASLTIAPLVKDYQEKTWITAYKKTYSTLNQATLMIMADNGGTMKGIALSHGALKTAYANQFKPAKICAGAISEHCWHAEGEWFHLNGATPWAGGIGYGFINIDGAFITFFRRSVDCTFFGDRCGDVNIDINGFKGPNVTGKDIHGFTILKNRIIPSGIGTDTCVSGGTGGSCGIEILNGTYDWEN